MGRYDRETEREMRDATRHEPFVQGGLSRLVKVIPATREIPYPEDLSRGKAVYERHCLSCHGASGRGDGPAAASLRVAPANFQRFGSFLKSDEELLRTIEHGVVFSPMHSWRGQLTDEEMSDVLSYVRFLAQQAR